MGEALCFVYIYSLTLTTTLRGRHSCYRSISEHWSVNNVCLGFIIQSSCQSSLAIKIIRVPLVYSYPHVAQQPCHDKSSGNWLLVYSASRTQEQCLNRPVTIESPRLLLKVRKSFGGQVSSGVLCMEG